MRKFNLKKLLCVFFTAILLVVSMPTTVFAASYPSIIIVSSESTTTVMKGEEGLLRFMIIPQYKNEKYHVEMYNSNGTKVASVEDTYYNSGDTYQRYININVDTAELNLAAGTYTVKYWLSFYSLYQWNDAPNKYTCTFTVTPYVCNGEHVYDNNCDANCNACDEYRTPTHSYSGNCDTSCNVCGNTRTTSTNHTYSNSTDTTCNVCGYTRVVIPQDNSRIIDSGTCGANLTWKLTAKGTLTISGKGNMYSYSDNDELPWAEYSNNYDDYTVKNVIIEEGVTSIGNYAFAYCDIEKVSIPSTVTKIGEDCFSSTLLREVVLPDGIKTIPKYAFHSAELLESIVIPSSVQSFQQGCFDECSSLQYFIIPNGVTKIAYAMFWGCSSLEYVQIPDSVTEIETFAFHECGNLSDIYFTGSNSQYSAIEIDSLNKYNEGLLYATVHYNSKAPCVFCQYGGWVKVNDTTRKHACVNCGKTETANHNWDAGVITKQPNCMEEGSKTYTCAGCNFTKKVTLGKTTYHTYGSWSNVDSDNHKHSCTVCGKEETAKHVWNVGTALEFPSFTQTGTAKYDCQYCSATKQSEISKLKNGWNLIVGKWYFGEKNSLVKNAWRKDSKGWVYLGSDGAMKTNAWVRDSVGWCYVGADGYAVTNCWKKDSVGWCYLNSNGSMVKNNWVLDGGKWYFIDGNGYMISNKWRKDSKGWVYLGSDGAMKTNAWVRDSVGWCYVGADGYAVTNCWKKDSVGWCYLNSNGSMVKNNWVLDGGKWYYLNGNGYMISSTWRYIGGKNYYFNASGICTNP